MLQNVNTIFLTELCGCKLNTLLHIKQLFVNNHINCLAIRKQCFKRFMVF